MWRTTLDEAFHTSAEESLQLRPGRSRWGHDGVFATVELDDEPTTIIVYRLPGPHTVLEIDDDENGSFDILRGYGTDPDFNALLDELGPQAGVGKPPFALPPGEYAIDYLRQLDKLLRERLEAAGFDGWWMGGELVLWDYDRLSKAERVSTSE